MTTQELAERARNHPGAVSPADRARVNRQVVQAARRLLRDCVEGELVELERLVVENNRLRAEMARMQGEHARDRRRWEMAHDTDLARARAEGRREGHAGHGNRILKGLT